MLTRQGWLALISAAALAVAGRAFGILELYVAATVLALLVLGAFVYVRTVRLRLRIARNLSPPRVHAGDTARVELGAVNLGSGRTPVLRLRDPVAGTRGALLHLAPLRSGESARAAYRLPTTKRGIVRVGPLDLEVSDPFGLASRRAEAAPAVELTVYPRVDAIRAPKGGGERNPHGDAISPNALGRQGDDFYALREYVVGDDLRRVHWPSTARSDELMVRHDEMPWQDRTTVVLDVRRAAHSAGSFERAVSAAASVIAAAHREQHLARFLSSDGADSNLGVGLAHMEGVLEYLARIEPSNHGSLRSVFEGLANANQGGVLVAVLGRGTSGELDTLARLTRRYRVVVAVVTEGPMPKSGPLHGAIRRIDATTDTAFGAGWGTMARVDRSEVPA